MSEEAFTGLISEREYDYLSDVSAVGFDWSGTVSRDIDSAWEANKKVYKEFGLTIEKSAEEWVDIPPPVLWQITKQKYWIHTWMTPSKMLYEHWDRKAMLIDFGRHTKKFFETVVICGRRRFLEP